MSKTKQVLKRFAGKLWTGILYIWNRPIIVSAILLVAAVLLFNVITKQIFKPYTNCDYLIHQRLGWDSLFCNGYTFDLVWPIPDITIPGLKVMDPPLEIARTVIAWTIIIFFAFLSMFLTILINRFTSVIKILTFNKEEWRRFMASIRIWLLLFVIFGSIFYFNVIR